MYSRAINILKTNSFFLFGARGTGKSTLIRELIGVDNMLEIDLLDPLQYEEATLGLPDLTARLEYAAKEKHWIFIDEIQKVPKLLDLVQRLIDRYKARIALTGSSARKLRRGGANLLAGRAYTYNLFPLTSVELADDFDLTRHIAFGGLPHIWNVTSDQERALFLRSYISTYLKEEIAEEQIVRNLEPFGRFLQVAAQSSGKIINYSNIARDVGVSDQTVKTYFQILEDTLLGAFLPAFDQSVRKSQGKSPKFYLFDTGIIRALRRTTEQPLTDSNYEYGDLFEHFVIAEIRRQADYRMLDFQYSFLRTSNDKELDLIIDRPGLSRVVIEIKSTLKVRTDDIANLQTIGSDIPSAKLLLLSRDPEPRSYGEITCYHWTEGLRSLFGEIPN